MSMRTRQSHEPAIVYRIKKVSTAFTELKPLVASTSNLQDLTVYVEDIYFVEVNTKYISSSAVKRISIFHECVARVKMLIFSPHEMKYILYLP